MTQIGVAVLLLAGLAACGGGDRTASTNETVLVASTTTVVGPLGEKALAAPLGPTCYDGGVANTLGLDDPFSTNTWALENTGPTQIVSAVNNNGLAGIDANVKNVHKGGNGCTGRGVVIAIVDTALDIAHEDLVDNVVPNKSWNFATNLPDPTPGSDQTSTDHGTGVAGVAAARGWNGKGSRGTGPFASLVAYPTVGVTAASTTTYSDMTFLSFGAKALADGTQMVTTLFGNRADATAIFNYSAGADYAAPPQVNDLSPSTLAAKFGTSNLRNGLGALYFQASGNEYSSMNGTLPDGTSMKVNCPAILTSDASKLGGELSNLKGMSCGNPGQESGNKPYFYSIASMHNTGKASSYSVAGSANWVTGFGGEFGTDEVAMISTDNSGCSNGGNRTSEKSNLIAQVGEVLDKLIADSFGAASSKDVNCNYTGRMNGTSAATPSVAGVTSLILEANPKLTWQDVGFILAKSAKKVDLDIARGANVTTFKAEGSEVAWNLDDPWIVNSAGFNFQSRYGFGMIDADAAVKLAINYTAPTGRRTDPIVVAGGVSTARKVDKSVVGINISQVAFPTTGAVGGVMRLDMTITNNTDADVNPGMLQFVIENTVDGAAVNTKSILMPAFTSWYAGGKAFPIRKGGQQQFRLHTNAFYGETLGTYKVFVIDFSGSTGVGKTLSFTPTLTSFSM